MKHNDNPPSPIEKTFCPILESRCREECEWFHEFIYMDDDGFTRECHCAVNVIANNLCDIEESMRV